MAVTAETLRVVKQIRKDLTAMTDAQTLELTRAWVNAWDSLAPDFQLALLELMAASKTGTVTSAMAARSIRLRDALQQARTTLDELTAETNTLLTNDVGQAVLDAMDHHAALIQSQLPPGHAGASVSFTRTSPDALAAIVKRTTEQIHSATLPIPADVERLMKQQLIRGIAVGDNPKRTASRIVSSAEGRFNGGLTRALTVARTETLDAHRSATKASEGSNVDVLEEWEWHASLGARTCPSCWSKHGTRHPLTEPGPEDHQCGRCTRVSVTKSWKDLGFNIEEPKSLTPDAEQVFGSLTAATQRDIMGAQRLELLQSGQISWANLSTKRETPGWRDSYTVTPVKDLLAKAG